MSNAATASEVGTEARAGRYLTFGLDGESYGIPVLKVREIIRQIDVTPVPRMPAHVLGVINLRGKVIPVIDLRVRFDLGGSDFNERTCTVVVQANLAGNAPSLLGLVVDRVEEVALISADEIEPAPDFGASIDTNFIVAMARVKGNIKALLDLDKIVAGDIGDLPEPAG